MQTYGGRDPPVFSALKNKLGSMCSNQGKYDRKQKGLLVYVFGHASERSNDDGAMNDDCSVEHFIVNIDSLSILHFFLSLRLPFSLFLSLFKLSS